MFSQCPVRFRYNDYVNDPLSRCNCTPSHNADYAIAARNDLNPEDGAYPIQILEHMMFGATDLKVRFAHVAQWHPAGRQRLCISATAPTHCEILTTNKLLNYYPDMTLPISTNIFNDVSAIMQF